MKLLGTMFRIDRSGADSCQLSLMAGHVIYRAHFPGKPVTPGVCIVKMLGELLELRLNTQLELREIRNLKFIAPISPVDDGQIEVVFDQVTQAESAVQCKGSIVWGERIYTKFSLIFGK
ncbi:hypothetical protein [Prevotella sp. kh1p2]|uniref:hypothetical protein n=1 Tax=Prevotella sp. kh1p2 TaxID=1761883 RepID=UPI0008AB21CD|nr:hypothetical protein [Prevotella sp. kh1p2]SET25146.1 3-hydroxyacyl-[acyl-carrier-protein] dehydratase [Prevotella sp. kh1p2]SNU12397.1 3-hydroxyacyl-[acyl-carrier-protein] dehydratase [Prevotellaceae bacterium KH2P17]